MRMSCNGCRVLRKGCSDDCTIRPCLQWIKSADAQANATLFLAKFYGRAGLLNLIDAGPEHLRPAIFRSLLYEACGRIVNPIFGSVGLLWAGNWAQCQETVDAVLQGSTIPQNPSSNAPAPHQIPPLSTYDIRHVSKDTNPARDPTKPKTRTRFKRSVNRASSHDSWLSQLGSGDTKDDENVSIFSVETVEGSLSNRTKLDTVSKFDGRTDDSEVGLELTLGLNYVSHPHVCMGKGKSAII